ncbi:probable cytochrome P450 CYP44 [Procambarus clarkii]|uniref:probable cytochrome P450 CYP44 n=1 Tax=Procambarus clarkii TaxID=6728 RepID=UPI001E672C0D|nr:probable cytochrome P450 CYP44 [Procambarus clarkii]
MRNIKQYTWIQRWRIPWSSSYVHKYIVYKWKPHQYVRYMSHISPSIPAGSLKSAKPFSSIPGPVSLPVLGTLFPYKLGLKKLPTYHRDVCDLYHKYGPIVREVFGSQVVVHVFDPADIRAVYENDGKTPFIPPLQETTQFYRQQKKMSLGLGNLNGEEWYKLRHAVQQMMLRPREVSYYYPLQDNVAKSAVDKLALEINDTNFSSKLHYFVAKWILESAGMCCFEKSLGCFNGGEKEDLAQKLVEANIKIFQLSAELKFSLRLYRYFKTPKYKRLHALEDFFYGVSIKFIRDAMDEIKALMKDNKLKDGQFNFLTYLMSRKELSEKDIITITLSLFSDGLSTTAPTLLGNLHCLALNPSIQDRLYQEIRTHVDPNAPITVQIVNKLPYLRAFVKEVFRFYPIGESVQRLPQKDMVLSGYHVPAGTYIDLNAYVWLQCNDYFKDPNILRPERWLRDSSGSLNVDPYILNPFSIGTRMCAGRRFAEQDLYIGLCRLLLKFHLVATDSSPPQQNWSMLLRPKIPLPLQFILRK